MTKRLKVLMSAYACEPNRGSEPEVGWQWALQMARFHDVTVVTRANNQQVIESALSSGNGPLPEFVYYDLPGWLRRCKRRGLPVAIYYTLWQAGVRRLMAARLPEFDLIHHVTFNSFRQPGFWWFCHQPIVLGPLGGGQICPWRFLAAFGRKIIPEAARSLSVLGSAFLPHLYASYAAATTVLTANQDTARRIPRRYRAKVESLLETGIPTGQLRSIGDRSNDGLIRIIWVSRLEKIKGGSLALRAFARAAAEVKTLRLSMAGNGPEEASLRSLAGELGIGALITWHGLVAKSAIPDLLAKHDLFLFTSLRDTSGNVLLEAMAAGLPAVTLLHHGAAEISTDQTAIRVLPTTPARTAREIAEAMVRLARAPELRREFGENARRRIAELYVWDTKAEQMDRIYRKVVAKGTGV
jgi:glycosyltransferase involved in cell wall biosynthesis